MTAFFDLPVRRFRANGVEIAARIDGSGPPLLLMHGHPQTHAIWHRVWPELTRHRTCVAADLRGYGDSSKPAASADQAAHSKRTMAAEMGAVMRGLGHDRRQGAVEVQRQQRLATQDVDQQAVAGRALQVDHAGLRSSRAGLGRSTTLAPRLVRASTRMRRRSFPASSSIRPAQR